MVKPRSIPPSGKPKIQPTDPGQKESAGSGSDGRRVDMTTPSKKGKHTLSLAGEVAPTSFSKRIVKKEPGKKGLRKLDEPNDENITSQFEISKKSKKERVKLKDIANLIERPEIGERIALKEGKKEGLPVIEFEFPEEKPVFVTSLQQVRSYVDHFKADIKDPVYNEDGSQDPDKILERAQELSHSIEDAIQASAGNKKGAYLLDFYSLEEVYQAASIWLGPGASTDPNAVGKDTGQKRPKKREVLYKEVVLGDIKDPNAKRVATFTVYSADGLRVFRPPAHKVCHGHMFMGNCEVFKTAGRCGAPLANIHINIKFPNGSISMPPEDCAWPEFQTQLE